MNFTVAIFLFSFVTIAAAAQSPQEQLFSDGSHNRGQFPFYISFQLDGIHKCGGILLDKQWGATVDTCFTDGSHLRERTYPNYTLVLGSNKMPATDKNGQICRPEKYFSPPENTIQQYGHLMLFKLSCEIQLDENIAPAQISNNSACPIADDQVAFIGYHLTLPNHQRFIQLVQGNIVNTATCRVQYGSRYLFSHIFHQPHRFDNTALCVSNGIRGYSNCIEYQGNPVVAQCNGSDVVVGLTLFWIDCFLGKPAVTVRLSEFASWIQKTMKNN